MLSVFSGKASGARGRSVQGRKSLGLLAGVAALAAVPLTGHAQTFSNTTSIDIPRNTLTQGPASLYASTITVSGVGSMVVNLNVTFTGLSHAYPDDIDVLLVGPNNQNVLLMSDTGGRFAISGLTLTFSDSAAGSLPDETQIVSGTYLPTNYDGPYAPSTVDSFAGPAPLTGPYGSTLSVFNGSNPNGVWSLYVLDDEQGNSGVMASGWSLTVTAVPEPSTYALCAGALLLAGVIAVRRRSVSARP